MDRLDQGCDILRRSRRNDAVPEIEDMPWGSPGRADDRSHFTPNDIGIGEQYQGIEVALKRNLLAQTMACRAEVHGPVEPDA